MGRTDNPQDRRPWHGRAAAGLLLRGLLTLMGLAVVAFGFVRFDAAYDDRTAYYDAPACGAQAAGPQEDCLRLESGRVTKKWMDPGNDSTSYGIAVARENAPSDTYAVRESFYDAVDVGSVVELRFWHGRVAEIAYQGHRTDPPSTPWLAMLWIGLLVGAGTTVLARGLAGPSRGDWRAPAGTAVGLFLATWFGGGLMLSQGWPWALAMGLSASAWLIAAVFAVAVA
ncbi:hypothetical protein [Kitasatospora sp. NPDC093102]|uniref:hypothetical protein n=1 Tax=Kitasatospora sp. NPDC093102 TaxID=3155069 RepID=UPI0034275B87